MFKARTGQYPSRSDLGARALALKSVRKRLEPAGKRFGAAGELGVRFCRGGRGRRRRLGPLLDDLVSQEQRREQKLARFGQSPEPGQRLTALGIDQARGGVEAFLFAIPARHGIDPAGDRQVDQRGHLDRGLADQLVEFGDGFAHPRPQLLVSAAWRLAVGQRPLDPFQGPLGAVEGSRKRRVVHCSTGYAS